jgi:hypothetical protein
MCFVAYNTLTCALKDINVYIPANKYAQISLQVYILEYLLNKVINEVINYYGKIDNLHKREFLSCNIRIWSIKIKETIRRVWK